MKKSKLQESKDEEYQILNALEDVKKGKAGNLLETAGKIIQDLDQSKDSDEINENYDFAVDYEYPPTPKVAQEEEEKPSSSLFEFLAVQKDEEPKDICLLG